MCWPLLLCMFGDQHCSLEACSSDKILVACRLSVVAHSTFMVVSSTKCITIVALSSLLGMQLIVTDTNLRLITIRFAPYICLV